MSKTTEQRLDAIEDCLRHAGFPIDQVEERNALEAAIEAAPAPAPETPAEASLIERIAAAVLKKIGKD